MRTITKATPKPRSPRRTFRRLQRVRGTHLSDKLQRLASLAPHTLVVVEMLVDGMIAQFERQAGEKGGT